ncbi:MAG: hypothetical protein II000_11115 [Clostridia bacterium]|nr:hypothetical protein [Clostridia bacterium]
MKSGKQLVNRWKNDYDFSTLVTASGSFASTVIFAFYNGFLGIYHSSIWHGSISAYYIVLAFLRAMIIASNKRISLHTGKKKAIQKAYLTASVLLLVLNVSLIVPISLMVLMQKPVNLTLIPAIIMASYTTYRVIMAAIHLKKRAISSNILVRLLRTINFIDALVSVLTLQNTLIMVNANAEGYRVLLPLTSVTSAAVWITVLVLSVIVFAGGIRSPRRNS